MKKEVILIRHGQTAWNAERRWQGHVDIPLSEEGVRQAELLAEQLREHQVKKVYSSDLERAWRTAEIVAEKVGLQVVRDPALREVAVGKAEGLNRDALIRLLGEEALEAWGSLDPRHLDFAFPGGESKQAALDRAWHFIERTLRQGEDSTIALVSHGMVLRLFLQKIIPDLQDTLFLANCGRAHLTFDTGTRRWTREEGWDSHLGGVE